ncbi:unnamed protein product, partial [Coccothraustes coccothraustes]
RGLMLPVGRAWPAPACAAAGLHLHPRTMGSSSSSSSTSMSSISSSISTSIISSSCSASSTSMSSMSSSISTSIISSSSSASSTSMSSMSSSVSTSIISSSCSASSTSIFSTVSSTSTSILSSLSIFTSMSSWVSLPGYIRKMPQRESLFHTSTTLHLPGQSGGTLLHGLALICKVSTTEKRVKSPRLCLSRTPTAALAALLTATPPSPSCRPVLSNSKVAQAQIPALSLSPRGGLTLG